jgi:hypothetical protein
MDLEMVLNELSLQTPAADIPTARQRMSDLISTVQQATKRGIKKILRTHRDVNTIELAPEYPVARWRNDGEVDLESRRFFRTLTAKAPFWTDVPEEIKNDFDLSEVLHQEEQAIGLGFALVSDALAVSLNSEARWDCSRLELEVTRLDDSEELIDERVEIVHASRSNHVGEHADWIKERIRIAVRDGVELWNRKDELFPKLIFCDSVGEQLQSLSTGNPMLRQVVKRLSELEECCKNWTVGAFDLDSLPSKASPESDSRLKRLKQELTFKCPDGENRTFSLHLRMTPAHWRLHFSAELGTGKIIIGYIGPKLQ